jgi:hypothetical protein
MRTTPWNPASLFQACNFINYDAKFLFVIYTAQHTKGVNAVIIHMNGLLERADAELSVIEWIETSPSCAPEVLQKVQLEMVDIGIPEPVKNTILSSQLLKDASPQIGTIRDLLCDVRELLTGDSAVTLPKHVGVRSCCISATRIYFRQRLDTTNDDICTRITPMRDIALRLNTTSGTYIMKTPNRFVLWMWIGAIRSRASGRHVQRLESQLRLIVGDNEDLVSCMISSEDPEQIVCVDPVSGIRVLEISLRSVTSIDFSFDHAEAEQNKFEISVLSARVCLKSEEFLGRTESEIPVKTSRDANDITSLVVLQRGAEFFMSVPQKGLAPHWHPDLGPDLVFGASPLEQRYGCVDAYIFSDGTNAKTPLLIGHAAIRLSSLLQSPKLRGKLECNDCCIYESEILVNSAIVAVVLVDRCEGMRELPKECEYIYIRGSHADWKNGNIIQSASRIYSRTLPASLDPIWEDEELLFSTPVTEVYVRRYILLEVVAKLLIGEAIFGQAMITIDQLGNEYEEMRLPLTFYDHHLPEVVEAKSFLVVRAKKVMRELPGLSSVTLQTKACTNDPLTTMWPCDVIPTRYAKL